MIRFKQGSVTNPQTGNTVDIIVKSVAPNSIKDIIVGGGLVLAGVAYMAVTAFKNGAKAMTDAESVALWSAGLMGEVKDGVVTVTDAIHN